MNIKIKPAKVTCKIDAQRIYPKLEDLEITPSNEEQKYSGSYGNVKVNKITGENIIIEPNNEQQVFSGVYTNVTVNEVKGDSLEVTPNEQNQTFNGLFNEVTVIGDENLVPENIKKGIVIFGIEGTHEGTSEETINYITSGLVTLYKFEGNMNDAMKVNNASNFGLSFVKDEELNKIVCEIGEGYGTFNVSNIDKQNFTISVLAKSDGTNTDDNNMFFGIGGNELMQDNALTLKASNGKFGVEVSYGAFLSDFDVNDGKWHRYTARLIDSNNISLYVDGNLILTRMHSLNLTTESIGLIGSWLPSVGLCFKGRISNALIYNRGLTDEEIAFNYQQDNLAE